ncbi:hypothetical protein EJ05DRAFT_514619 [Pseudovirgaria hyperparasitica]|uniref:Extracellular serine-rich protein n=1 Tax=Pseudovirgaria hyperparasitica TaxID=470096 RepID=A0A6A6VWP6_9PEZI|nr:uncharacterized protein EJ05DRAFT_514619 [Pseudovirgaria hyperparasitica]KAF2753661.1 hypothetical protein EJ05DRAFT_514619 [Pseudovirgaria hyperparasitica]
MFSTSIFVSTFVAFSRLDMCPRFLCLLLVDVFISCPFVNAISVKSNILVIAQNDNTLSTADAVLKGYGIPYTNELIATSTDSLPSLNDSATSGNYGGFIVHGTALSTGQLQQIYSYQAAFGVRMVRWDVVPTAEFGMAEARSGCCNLGTEQLVSITDTTFFPTAGYKTGAGITTEQLWHTPGTIANSSIATEVAQFASAGTFKTSTTAAVVNKIGNREQLVWFMPFEAAWSVTSHILMHSWVHFLTRGIYTGFRRVNLGTQVDDVHLVTGLYSPKGSTFRLRAQDLEIHKTWLPTIISKMNPGSNFYIELAHNGNGNVANASSLNSRTCSPGAITYTPNPETTVEFVKPPGTGTNVWPSSPTSFSWTTQCLALDTMEQWFAAAANLNTFAHLSHTFTHLSLNNATYADTAREIAFNKAWLTASGIASATHFSPNGLVPPAITGLHNLDALQAWLDNGISSAVGDNTRTSLLNTQNEHWPLLLTAPAPFTIIPRWATNIYFNCDLPACIEVEYRDASGGTAATFAQVLDIERETNVRHLFALRRDPFMFHQANMRAVDVAGGKSLLMTWIETVVGEFVRIVSWPILTLTHDALAQAFLARRTRDMCEPSLVYNLNAAGNAIESVTVSATNMNCASPIPVSLPGDVVSRGTATAEQVGSDPLTLWVQLAGTAQTFVLTSSVPVVRGS